MFNQRIADLLKSPDGLLLTKEIELLETQLSAKLGFRHAVAVSSGTAALELSLRALELKSGAEVIVPAYSYVGTAGAVVWSGLTPKFADVSAETGLLTVETLKPKLTGSTRAVLLVDLFGRQCHPAVYQWCRKQGLYVIEDGAQGLGLPNRKVIFAASFNPSKPVGALGNGGAILCDDPEVATRIREIRNQGGLVKDHYTRAGTNAWMDPLQAAILNLKLRFFERWLDTRESLAMWYHRSLRDWAIRAMIELPQTPEGTSHVWSAYPTKVGSQRKAIRDSLEKMGIATRVPYYPTLPEQPAFRRYAAGEYPNSIKFARQILCIPFFPELTGKEVSFVVESLGKCLNQYIPRQKDTFTSSSSSPSSPRTLDR